MGLGDAKWITLGHPSYVWRFGQDRRLALVQKYVDLENQRILDVGCGIGMYMRKFREFSNFVHGVDVDAERVAEAAKLVPNARQAPAEALPYPDDSFDVVFLNEVIEHVDDDRQALAEAVRVAAPGGHVVIYAPNRLYLFETHGIYLGKRYIFRLIPFVNYLPDALRRRFCPHVRAYTGGHIRGLFDGQPVEVVAHTCVYPGFDNIVARRPLLGRMLRNVCYLLESTPLRSFGLSHLLIVRKRALEAPARRDESHRDVSHTEVR